ncbi:hypothetical protein ACFWMG_47805, partial [Streptomyces sp. NPDC127074]|uniref:hypothetical protein n=1 Tax=Streptomyces sp. NPDC127074 TaxID=3347130 RepID=UPI00364EEFE9
RTPPRRAGREPPCRPGGAGGPPPPHPPPGRRSALELISCPGSRRIAPLLTAPPKLFGNDEPPTPGQQSLF